MTERQTKRKRFRQTRLKVLAAALAVGFGITGLMGFGMVRGDVPLRFAVSGEEFYVSASWVELDNIEVYPRTVDTANNGKVPTVVAKIGSLKLKDLCLAMPAPNLPGVGTFVLVAEGSGDGTSASDLMVDVDLLAATPTLHDVVVGTDAAAHDPGSSKLATSISSRTAVAVDVGTIVRAIRIGTVSVKDVKVKLMRDTKHCGPRP
ncbi:MAG: DUF6230 family protein [Gordonia sp. (in: high G+C Gram-positive bacteria)]|uniref:DUF6230 family protein n=1 Tax=Gordonia sp. (in: high G+C Gram-positive bacteria) TaxID=84139 RepID=UPI0039E4CADD